MVEIQVCSRTECIKFNRRFTNNCEKGGDVRECSTESWKRDSYVFISMRDYVAIKKELDIKRNQKDKAKENFIIQYVLARAACTPSTPGIVKDAFTSWDTIQERLNNEK